MVVLLSPRNTSVVTEVAVGALQPCACEAAGIPLPVADQPRGCLVLLKHTGMGVTSAVP